MSDTSTAKPQATAADFIFVQHLQLGASNGLRVGIKDSIDVEGFATRLGSACLADAPPAERHAEVVRALLEAGARIVGKTNMHELAYGVTGINLWTGTPRNPRAPGRVPGGSSSGSAAAVAARLVDFAIATDTGGSIRIPAACCGVYGLKPTFGRVSRSGVHPAVSSLDCVGPIAPDLAMIERAMQMLDPAFRASTTPRRGTVGWVETQTSPVVERAARQALEQANIAIQPISLASFEPAFAAGLAIIGAETWRALGHLLDCVALGLDVRTRLLGARAISPADVAAAERVRHAFRSEVDEALSHVDALALPTLPDYPLTLARAGNAAAALHTSSLVRPFNLSGHPALTLPVAAEGDLPVGLQLIGRPDEEAALCALARAVGPAPRSTEVSSSPEIH